MEIREEENNKKTIEYLEFLRDECSDEIPEEVIHFGKFKVRKNWFNGVVGGLEIALNKGLIPEELKKETEEFLEYYTSDEFHDQPLRTREDIERANGLLDKVLGRK